MRCSCSLTFSTCAIWESPPPRRDAKPSPSFEPRGTWLRSPAWALDVFVGPHRAGDLTSARGKGVLVTQLACAVNQVADRDLAASLRGRRPGLEPDHVRLR